MSSRVRASGCRRRDGGRSVGWRKQQEQPASSRSRCCLVGCRSGRYCLVGCRSGRYCLVGCRSGGSPACVRVGSAAAQPSPSTGSATHGGPLTSLTARAGHLGEGKISHRQRLDRARDGLLRYRSASHRFRSACEAMRYLRPLMAPSKSRIDLFHVGAHGPHVCRFWLSNCFPPTLFCESPASFVAAAAAEAASRGRV
jgi:hypothetical protein